MSKCVCQHRFQNELMNNSHTTTTLHSALLSSRGTRDSNLQQLPLLGRLSHAGCHGLFVGLDNTGEEEACVCRGVCVCLPTV